MKKNRIPVYFKDIRKKELNMIYSYSSTGNLFEILSIPPMQLLKNTLNVLFYTGAVQTINIKSSTDLV